MAQYLYNFRNVTAIVGATQIDGFADGDDSIIITFGSAAFNKVVGSNGDVTYSFINDDTAQVTFRLKHGSPSNDYFSGLYLAYKTGNFPTTPLIIRDAYGRSLHTAPQIYISSRPNATYGANQNNHEWVCEVGNLTSFAGGSGPVS